MSRDTLSFIMMLYLNDANGLKSARLTDIKIDNPAALQISCIEFLCKYLIFADPTTTFFAQNTSTHVSYISRLIKKVSPHLTTLYISDHEIRWIKEMLEVPGYQPDSTHSNYRLNDPVFSEIFEVRMFPFNRLEETVRNVRGPAIFYTSHVSRLTGECAEISSAFGLIKESHPESILIVDGAQALGAVSPFKSNEVCDVYLSMSSKFIGAEPNLGIAFISHDFYERYVLRQDPYPMLDTTLYSRDLFSLWDNLQNPRFKQDYSTYIKSLKSYAIGKIAPLNPTLVFTFSSQAPNFLTLNFGSAKSNKEFVEYASNAGICISDNVNPLWSLIDPPMALVRVGLSVRTEKEDIDMLVSVITSYKETASR